MILGFEHTAFAFAYESRIAETRVFDEYVPPGALITFLQKALQYIELESHVRDVSAVHLLWFVGHNRSGLQCPIFSYLPSQMLKFKERS